MSCRTSLYVWVTIILEIQKPFFPTKYSKNLPKSPEILWNTNETKLQPYGLDKYLPQKPVGKVGSQQDILHK